MSTFYRDGLIAYQRDDYQEALKQFLMVIKEDPEYHQVWDAIGMCHCKLKDYRSAAFSFEKALLLHPSNSLYQERYNSARKMMLSEIHPYPTEVSAHLSGKQFRYDNNGYRLGILFFVPVICFIINIWLGIVILLFSAYLIYRDALSVHAGCDPGTTGLVSWPARNWGVLTVFIWVAVPLYIYKRRAIFQANINYFLMGNTV